MFLERQSKLQSIIALLLLRLIALLFELFIAVSSLPSHFYCKRHQVFCVLKSRLLLKSISNASVGKTINGFV